MILEQLFLYLSNLKYNYPCVLFWDDLKTVFYKKSIFATVSKIIEKFNYSYPCVLFWDDLKSVFYKKSIFAIVSKIIENCET